MRTGSCNFLEGNYLLVCKAGRRVYVPSLYEMKAYCKDTQYRICPHYLNTRKRKMFKPPPPRFVNVE
jgi:hypothetical protein